MPSWVIVIFLLFFAVLAFAWFYLQRAKMRDAAKTETSQATTTAPDSAPDSGPDSTPDSTLDTASRPVDPSP